MTKRWEGPLQQVDEFRWEIPQSYKPGMLTNAIVYADEAMMKHIREDFSLEQAANVATLPGIVGSSLAMPDIHWGYGFPIGGVAATRQADGLVSPGGVGFDINCGVRLLHTNLTVSEVKPKIAELVDAMFVAVPSGLGTKGKIRLRGKEIDEVLRKGARWAVESGYGEPSDLIHAEEGGEMKGADPDKISARAKERGVPQLGTLGSGNHFLEVQVVEEIYDAEAARVLGIEAVGQVTVFIHTGSRGLGYQVCDDYLKVMAGAVPRYGVVLPDRQLAGAPVRSPEGQDYLAAMAGAANYAWANRQAITHWVREAFGQVLRQSPRDLGMWLVYDVAHNIAKLETHPVKGKPTPLCVHRKGATRAFPPGHPEVPARYRGVGQPVLIPGDMGRYSYVAVGTEAAMRETWGSTCHGAGRRASRGAALRALKGVNILKRLEEQGITARVVSPRSLAEEASEAYKDVAEVVRVADGAGISRSVAKVRPLGVVKG
ncbi:MAG: RtcB family protein [Chloroflexi bacterium]|nr:RtcB family protein [Chloroflexota bacterium]